MELIKTIIIEDENQAIIALRNEIDENCPDIDLCGEASTIWKIRIK